MKRIILFELLIAYFVLLTFPTKAQFSIDGQFRTRAEYRDGYRSIATESNHPVPIVLQRSRLIFNHKEENISFRFSGQDARVWGQNVTNMPANTPHIYEAWAKWEFLPRFSVKMGRQELRYDDQRLIAIRNFGLTGATYDAALFAYENEETKTSFHLGTMINNLAQDNFLSYYSTSHFKYMSFLWGALTFSDFLSINFLNIFDLSQNPLKPEVMFGRNTVGGNVIINSSNRVGGKIGGYYQFGKTWLDIPEFPDKSPSVSAFNANATAWVKPIEDLKIWLCMDVYSGHDWSSNSKTFGAFNRLLAAGHAHLGFMDYFTTMQLSEVKYAGFVDHIAGFEYSFSSKASFMSKVHYFNMRKTFLPDNSAQGYEEVNKYLGTEVDFIFSYKVSKCLVIESAWMFILPSETLEKLKSSVDTQFSHWGYISLLFTPNFFKYSKPVSE